MYGMVNDGIRRFVVENHGEEAWKEICHSAGVKDDSFDTLSTVPDSVTYDLVGAICERFDIESDVALKAFGEYWPDFARQTAWGKLLEFSGDGFISCLESLDEMHDRIAVTMPHLQPPSFELEEVSETTFNLHYRSHRPGLTPMVIGLLHGLAKQFDVEIQVEHISPNPHSTDSELFLVKIVSEGAASQIAA